MECVRSFAERWDAQARSAGWQSIELYSLHRVSPFANLAAMGAAFLVARSGDRVAAIDDAIILRSVTGAVVRIRHSVPDPAAVLAWSLCAQSGEPLAGRSKVAAKPK